MACTEAGCALLGGETAEHGLMNPMSTTSPVRRPGWWSGTRSWARIGSRPATSCWPWSLPGCIQRLLAGQARTEPAAELDAGPPRSSWGGRRRTAGADADLYPRLPRAHRSGRGACDDHITGGRLASNLARVIPSSCHVQIDRTTWRPTPIFGLIQQLGEISQPDLEATFNMGVGMVAVLPPDSVDEAVRLLAGRGLRAWVCGSVTSDGAGTHEPVNLFGQHVAG